MDVCKECQELTSGDCGRHYNSYGSNWSVVTIELGCPSCNASYSGKLGWKFCPLCGARLSDYTIGYPSIDRT